MIHSWNPKPNLRPPPYATTPPSTATSNSILLPFRLLLRRRAHQPSPPGCAAEKRRRSPTASLRCRFTVIAGGSHLNTIVGVAWWYRRAHHREQPLARCHTSPRFLSGFLCDQNHRTKLPSATLVTSNHLRCCEPSSHLHHRTAVAIGCSPEEEKRQRAAAVFRPPPFAPVRRKSVEPTLWYSSLDQISSIR